VADARSLRDLQPLSRATSLVMGPMEAIPRGLFTSRAALESIGGGLTIGSRETVDTTARIDLPVAASDLASEVSCFTS